jgi:asparagine synthase (glutamine-hydrolysing)
MCGLSGIINKIHGPVSEDEIKSMNKKIIHRGPDSEGYYFDKNLALGFRRLSIIDLSNSANQPMTYNDKYVIVFNGEIFNYLEIKQELIQKGYKFKTKSDTEVILVSFQEWREKCTEKFNGMWAFALYDIENAILFCSRDRYGIKPFVYHINSTQIIIGSEIKQIAAIKSYKKELNLNVTYDFLENGLLNINDENFFSGVQSLTPGHNLTINLKDFKIIRTRYFDLTAIQELKQLHYSEAVEKFKRLFLNAVKIRLRADVTVGSFLSGGLDSSSIISTAKKLNNDHLSAVTYSSCYEDKKYDEQEYIDTVLSHLHLKSRKIFPDLNDLLDEQMLDKVSYHHDQPIVSASFFNEFKLFETAHNDKLKVVLDGQGSDEFLAGYLNFNLFNASDVLGLKFFKLINEFYSQQINHKISYSSTLRSTLSQLKSIANPRTRVVNSALLKMKPDSEYVIPKTNFRNYRDLSTYQILNSSIPHQLHAQDRSAMAYSVESRNPFLDFELTEFIYSLPDTFKMRSGTTKRILRDAMKNIVPDKILNRHHKMGFVAPEPVFMLNNKAKVLKLLKDAVQANSFLKPDTVKKFENINRYEDYDNSYFRVISFYSFQKQFNLF